ncbi:Uncharacterised protein [Mycobacteroides abscessus subsp. abscessus]|nr:Uncharacterised protein [Mycobacteroides abscessus subsp. abscessus]SKV53804.1 Uncharacterised protein [Mycobacteroides abscessus subsp. abscessus]
MRFSAVTSLSSVALRARGNQACSGWRAASAVNGAISVPSHSR